MARERQMRAAAAAACAALAADRPSPPSMTKQKAPPSSPPPPASSTTSSSPPARSSSSSVSLPSSSSAPLRRTGNGHTAAASHPFVCTVCERVYASKASLSKHTRRAHVEERERRRTGVLREHKQRSASPSSFSSSSSSSSSMSASSASCVAQAPTVPVATAAMAAVHHDEKRLCGARTAWDDVEAQSLAMSLRPTPLSAAPLYCAPSSSSPPCFSSSPGAEEAGGSTRAVGMAPLSALGSASSPPASPPPRLPVSLASVLGPLPVQDALHLALCVVCHRRVGLSVFAAHHQRCKHRAGTQGRRRSTASARTAPEATTGFSYLPDTLVRAAEVVAELAEEAAEGGDDAAVEERMKADVLATSAAESDDDGEASAADSGVDLLPAELAASLRPRQPSPCAQVQRHVFSALVRSIAVGSRA